VDRRATKKGGRFNPPEAWVWSEETTHEPIVTRELFDAAADVAKAEQRSRDGVGANTKHPDTKRSYVLRSFVFCELCGHRMHGKTRRQTAYYACHPSGNQGRGAERQYADHPVSIWVREESLLEVVLGFFSERVFGPNRRDLLEAELRRLGSDDDKEVLRRLRSLEKSIGQAESRQSRLIRSLELDDDPQGAMFRQIRQRMQQLEKERREKLEELEALRREQPDVSPGSPELLDELPVSDEQLVSAPEGLLRDLFDSFRLEVRYNKVSSWAKCRVAINEEGLDGLVAHSAVLLELAWIVIGGILWWTTTVGGRTRGVRGHG
jgi:site-specific DNA recombinase